MSHISGKLGSVYGSALLLDACESAWTTGGTGRAVSTTTGKVGTNCARCTTTSVAGTAILQYKTLSSTDLSLYAGIYFWVRSSVSTSAGDLQFLTDETAACASPEESMNIPALTAATWKQCFTRFAAASTNRDAVISMGLNQYTDLADGTFDIDDVEALKVLDGIKSWTLDYTADTLEVTDFDSSGIKAYIIGASGWSGSFEGFKDGAPLSIGSEVYLVLGESTTAYNTWIGKVVITGAHPQVSFDGLVTYSYDFTGTGALEMPSA